MEQVAFALDVSDGWPPVAIEHVWCERTDGVYQLMNAPFFIQGLAHGDRFTAEPDAVNGCIFDFSIVESSGHSLVWVLELDGHLLGSFKNELLSIGCSVEGFPKFGLHSVDVPPAVDVKTLDKSIELMEASGLSLAYPVWRHEAHAA